MQNESQERAQQQLVVVVRPLLDEQVEYLAQLKTSGMRELARPDFLWHYLLQSIATMGGVRGWERLRMDQACLAEIGFDALKRDPEKRRGQLKAIFGNFGVRWPSRKAGYLAEDFELIRDLGGPIAAKERLLAARGRKGKIAFLKGFKGIGDKYARNLMMDVDHPEFRDCIAIDQRIKALSRQLGLDFPAYEDHERFYLDVAKQLGCNGWELDRLLFRFSTDVLDRLKEIA